MSLLNLQLKELERQVAGTRFFCEPKETIHWDELFGNDRPVELEIGSGKGLFLANAAEQNPQHNFFGIELARKYALYSARRLMREDLSNACSAAGNGVSILRDFVADRSLVAVHIYFPDPWWKRRHRKRRIFNHAFVHEVIRVLKRPGYLYTTTDVEEYFRVMIQLVASLPDFDPLSPPALHAPEHDMDYLTNFERKYRKEGRSIYRASWITKQRDGDNPRRE